MDKRTLRSKSNTASPAAQEQMKCTKSPSKLLSELQFTLDECVTKINDRMEAVFNERLESLRSEIRKDFEEKIQRLEAKIVAQAN